MHSKTREITPKRLSTVSTNSSFIIFFKSWWCCLSDVCLRLQQWWWCSVCVLQLGGAAPHAARRPSRTWLTGRTVHPPAGGGKLPSCTSELGVLVSSRVPHVEETARRDQLACADNSRKWRVLKGVYTSVCCLSFFSQSQVRSAVTFTCLNEHAWSLVHQMTDCPAVIHVR